MRGEGTHDPGSRGGKAHTSGTPVLGAGRPSSSLENSSPASDQLLSEGSGPLSQPGPEAGRGPRALPLGPLKHPWGYYTFLRMRLTERRDWSLLLLPVRMEELESKVHSEQIWPNPPASRFWASCLILGFWGPVDSPSGLAWLKGWGASMFCVSPPAPSR